MKYIYTLILILIGGVTLISQEYFSKILPTVDNPLIKKMIKLENKYLIPVDHFFADGMKGGLLIYDEDGGVDNNNFENMDLCSNPLTVMDNSLFFLGENPDREGDSTFFLAKLDDPMGDQVWYKEFNVDSPQHNPRTIFELDGDIYVINVNIKTESGNYPHEISLYRFNEEGENFDIKKYNTDKKASFVWEAKVTADNSILMSIMKDEVDNGTDGPYSQLLKINGEGEIIWNYEGNEDLSHGAVPTWATELTDGNIVQTYYVDRKTDVNFIANNWYKEPNKFIWLSPSGDLVKDKFIITDDADRIYYQGVEAGRGDYFYAYGYMDSVNDGFGLKYSAHLTKFSNSGDTIWTHNYQHPKYLGNDHNYRITDIIEEENGDITILTEIRPYTAKNEVWLFRVNSEGCYINEVCEDMSDLTSSEELNLNSTLYPNPTSGWIHIEAESGISQVKITDMGGRLISNQTIQGGEVDLDLSDFETGMYLLHIWDQQGKKETKKVIKN